MLKRSTITWFVIAIFILPFSAWALVNLYERRIEPLPVLGKSKDHRVGGFKLINQDGIVRTGEEWSAKIVVADFFFTHCPTICPKMTSSMKQVAEEYAGDSIILLNSFTVDPARDSAAQLKKYQLQHGISDEKWDLLTGDKKEIYKLARNSFNIVATDGDGGPDDFIHSENLVLVDKQKRIRGYYDGTNEREVIQLINDIKRLRNE
jgi:protein SCO1